MSNQAILSELTRVKALFQQRAILAAMEVPLAVREAFLRKDHP